MFFLYEARLTYKSFNLLSVILSLLAEIICKCTSIDISLSFITQHGFTCFLYFHTCGWIKFLEKKFDSLSRIYRVLQIRALHSYDKVGLNHTQNYPIRGYRFRDKLNEDTARHNRIKTAVCMSPIEKIYSEWR